MAKSASGTLDPRRLRRIKARSDTKDRPSPAGEEATLATMSLWTTSVRIELSSVATYDRGVTDT
jgi:hypothetical protein